MQTKTIFHPALALLLCGAALLGLGLWENAAAQGQTPILFSENPQGFNECIANYGEFAIVGTDGDAQCTPRPPGWTPPAPVVAPDPGGVEVDEPAIPSPPEPARAAVPIFNPPGEPLDYYDRETCKKFGGVYELIPGFPGEHICSEIDINDTFCIGTSKEALPCKGLYDHVRRCNHYNRPALDPFHCAGDCGNKFACGNRCREGMLGPPGEDGFPVSNQPFPSFFTNALILLTVTTAAGIPGVAHYELLQEGTALLLSPNVHVPNSAIISLADTGALPREDDADYEFTVRVAFSCAGLEKTYGGEEISHRLEISTEPWTLLRRNYADSWPSSE